MKDLPPLQPLVAFEAAARLGSFKAAAGELCVTPSAVSQQIRALEEQVGAQLFERQPRQLVLTDAGERYAATVRDALRMLSRSTRELRERQGRRSLRFSTDPFSSYELVLPHLHEWATRFPAVELRVEASDSLVDFAHEPVDAALRFGRPPWPGLSVRELMPLQATLACAPENARKIQRPADVGRLTLLAIQDRFEATWHALAERMGFGINPDRVLLLDTYFAVLRAAEQGAGIAAVFTPLSEGWIRSGRLVEPFGERWPVGYALHFVCRHAEADRPELVQLSDWLAEICRAVSVPDR